MKALKLTALFAFAAMVFVSCSKKDDAPAQATGTGSLTYEGKSYQLDKGFFASELVDTANGIYGCYYAISSLDLNTADSNAVGHVVTFNHFASKKGVIEGTFTYMDLSNDDFDFVNFYQGLVGLNLNATGSTALRAGNGSTFTVAKSGDGYKIDYDITATNGKKVKGSYTGALAAW